MRVLPDCLILGGHCSRYNIDTALQDLLNAHILVNLINIQFHETIKEITHKLRFWAPAYMCA